MKAAPRKAGIESSVIFPKTFAVIFPAESGKNNKKEEKLFCGENTKTLKSIRRQENVSGKSKGAS